MDEKIFDSSFFKKLENICLKVTMPVSGGAAGGRKSRAKGSSVEFSDFREYSVGDDFRKIDWNAYGRFDKFFVKLFMEEREALVNIFIDASKSMDFGETKKSTTALRIAAALSFLSLNNSDRVAINLLQQEGIVVSKSIMGKNMFSHCINFLENVNFQGKTNINHSLQRKDFRQRGVSIIISDFLTDEKLEESIKYLAYKNQEFVLIHVLSKEELEPSMEGHIRLVDSETGEVRNVTLSAELLKSYERNLNKFTSSLEEKCTKLGGKYVLVSSEEDIEKIIFKDLGKVLDSK